MSHLKKKNNFFFRFILGLKLGLILELILAFLGKCFSLFYGFKSWLNDRAQFMDIFKPNCWAYCMSNFKNNLKTHSMFVEVKFG